MSEKNLKRKAKKKLPFKKAIFSLRKGLSKEKNIKWIKRLFYWGSVGSILVFLFWDLPLPTKLREDPPVSTKIFDRKGRILYEIFSDVRSTPVKLEELPPYVWQATISIEDKDFFKHKGLSVSGITRALYNTIFRGKLQGGSTLTQQLVKNSLLSPERTLRRKIREFVLTMVVETLFSKNQILEMYLNQIPYGGTAYGIGAASELYFGKTARELTLSEAAFLAGLPAAPSYYSPFGARPELSKLRQELVLKNMVDAGFISKEMAEKAAQEELKFSKSENFKAPHFVLWVKSLLAEKYGERLVEKGGLRVTTTLDLDLQEYSESVVAEEVSRLEKQNVRNGAVLVTRPSTGEILAMVGSKDYNASDEDGRVNIIFSKRQPGSSIKPLNYALAIKEKKITLSTPLADIPTCFLVYNQKPYCPTNYDLNFHGAVQARFALGNSYNIPAVRVLALNGIENFIEFARKMGITTFTDPKNYGLSLTLGGGEVTPYDMASVFGVFANQGIKMPLIPILKVENWKGKILEEVDLSKIKLSGERVLEPEVAFLISHTLYDNNARSSAFGENSLLNVKNHPEVSVKTGTTNERRDNWTIGYTPLVLVVAWVGNNDYSQMSGAVSGVSGASPIFNKIMKKTLDEAEAGKYDAEEKGHSWPLQPKGIVGANVCSTTGVVPKENENCPLRFEYFLEGTVPHEIKGGIQDVHFDKRTGLFIDQATPFEFIEVRQQRVLFDPLDSFICLDCQIPASSYSATVKYPLTEN